MALYVWGGNAVQQLGLDEDTKQSYDVRRVPGLETHALVDFSAGVHHSLAVTEFGEVFAWGRGREGQLGLGPLADPTVRTPTRVTALDGEVIEKVSCGDSHSLALSATGQVHMWGLLPETREVKNDGMFDHASVSLTGLDSAAASRARSMEVMERIMRGSEEIYEAQNMTKHDRDDTESSLAHLHSKKVQTVRHPCLTPRTSVSLLRHRIVNIAAGFAHSLAVSSDGIAFSCGYNDNGQLGLGSRRNAPDFEPVRGLEGHFVTQVACGQQHSLACTRLGVLGSDGGVCFAWGLGILGQLGLGINISWLPMEVHIGQRVVSIAAGSHHSVAVTERGGVYTWGHSEYGQHGVGERGRDLNNALYYFFPRLQESLDADHVVVTRVACSSHSTFALTQDGRVYSWGWNVFGVLGVGKYQHTPFPQPITGLKDNVAFHVSAGANHAGVLVRPRGCHFALRYDRVLKQETFYDVEFIVAYETTRMKAHQAIVCARSPYLSGLLRVLRAEQQHQQQETASLRRVVVVDAFEDIDVLVFRAFLEYLYTDRVEIVSHRRRGLMDLAKRVCLDELARACQVTWRRDKEQQAVVVATAVDGPEGTGMATFERDMETMVLNASFADVEFLWPMPPSDDEDESKAGTYVRLPAHKAVLSQVDYFRTMFVGGFSEGQVQQQQQDRPTSTQRHEIALHHMPQDGISLEAFKALLTWIYTGSVFRIQQLDPSEMMDLYVASSLMSLTVLASLCERQLIALLPRLQDDTASLRACADFAAQFDARRLRTLSERALKAVEME